MSHDPVELMEHAGIKPTSNRVIVVKALMQASAPMSLIELETLLGTLERSSILRVLTLLLSHKLVHIMEDGRGVAKYELCHCEDHCSVDDMHAHFYCERCERMMCLEEIAVPHIPLPEGYTLRSVNFMLKGLCPACSSATRD